MCVCVCSVRGNDNPEYVFAGSHRDTHTRIITLLCAWYVIHVLFNRRHSYRTGQDIENCGTCRDCACIIYRYVRKRMLSSCEFSAHIHHSFHMRALAAQCVSRRTVMCITLSFPLTSVWGVQFFFVCVFFFFHGLVGLLFCSVWQAQPECSTLGRATRRTNTAAGLITERSYESFIRTYHTHTLMLLPLRLNEVSNNTDLRRAPVCPLGPPPPNSLHFFLLLPYLCFTHTDAHCVKYTHTHTHTRAELLHNHSAPRFELKSIN